MSNKIAASDSWLASRLIFDASLVVGMLGFAASLWGVPGLKQLGVAALVGIACAAVCFAFLFGCKRAVQRLVNKNRSSHDLQIDVTENPPHDPVRVQGLPYQAYADDEHSMSLNSLSEDDRTIVSGFQPKLTPAFPTQWSVELIETLDWQVFDNLCIAFWKMKGNAVVSRSEGSVSGTRFCLAVSKNVSVRLGIVESRSAHSPAVSVDDMQKLLQRQAVNKLPLAVLMHASKLSNVVVSYCERNNIRLIGADNIYQGISALTEKQQATLLKTLIRPDYMIPTCPNCKIKLVKRMRKDTRRLFWGCISYPECRFNMDYVAPY